MKHAKNMPVITVRHGTADEETQEEDNMQHGQGYDTKVSILLMHATAR
jgi:hypothetical protein